MTTEEIEKGICIHLGLIGIDAKSLDRNKKTWRTLEALYVAISAMTEDTTAALDTIKNNEITPENVAERVKRMGLASVCCATIYNNPDTYKAFIDSFTDNSERKELKEKIADLMTEVSRLKRQVDMMSVRDSVLVKMNQEYKDILVTVENYKKDNDSLSIENARLRKQLNEQQTSKREIKPAVMRLPKSSDNSHKS